MLGKKWGMGNWEWGMGNREWGIGKRRTRNRETPHQKPGNAAPETGKRRTRNRVISAKPGFSILRETDVKSRSAIATNDEPYHGEPMVVNPDQ
jgi:hypothetical protein